MVHAYVKLQDQFSFAFDHKIVTVSDETFQKMQKSIGSTFNNFNKKAQIAFTWKVLDIQRATSEHFELAKVPEFVNQP